MHLLNASFKIQLQGESIATSRNWTHYALQNRTSHLLPAIFAKGGRASNQPSYTPTQRQKFYPPPFAWQHDRKTGFIPAPAFAGLEQKRGKGEIAWISSQGLTRYTMGVPECLGLVD